MVVQDILSGNLLIRLTKILYTITFLIILAGQCSASETSHHEQSSTSGIYYKQVATILKFYDILTKKEEPTVQDFFEFFSEHDESELDLGLRQDYPSFGAKEQETMKKWREKAEGKSYAEVVEKIWHDNPNAKNYADEIYLHPDRYPSRFLRCIKTKESLLFSQKIPRKLEFPPEVTKDFIKYSVLISGKKAIFEFVHDEPTIENVYLPDGKSIYDLILRCVKDKKKLKQ